MMNKLNKKFKPSNLLNIKPFETYNFTQDVSKVLSHLTNQIRELSRNPI
jgi:hypothetical protein